MPAVDKVNAAIADGLGSLGERHGPNRIGLIDCGSVFLTENDEATEVDANLMPDLLHPNRAGHRLLGDCILNYIKGLEKGRWGAQTSYMCGWKKNQLSHGTNTFFSKKLRLLFLPICTIDYWRQVALDYEPILWGRMT
jgi:hypothetical protein